MAFLEDYIKVGEFQENTTVESMKKRQLQQSSH